MHSSSLYTSSRYLSNKLDKLLLLKLANRSDVPYHQTDIMFGELILKHKALVSEVSKKSQSSLETVSINLYLFNSLREFFFFIFISLYCFICLLVKFLNIYLSIQLIANQVKPTVFMYSIITNLFSCLASQILTFVIVLHVPSTCTRVSCTCNQTRVYITNLNHKRFVTKFTQTSPIFS